MDETRLSELHLTNVGTDDSVLQLNTPEKILGKSFQYDVPEWSKIRKVGFDSCTFNEVDFDDVVFSGCVFLRCKFTNCSFNSSILQGIYFVDSELQSTTFIRAKLEGCRFNNVTFDFCTFSNGNWNNISFDSCKNNISSLIELSYENVSGWDLVTEVDSIGNKLIYDPSNNRVYHKKFAGFASTLINFLSNSPKYMTQEECEEHINIIINLSRVHQKVLE